MLRNAIVADEFLGDLDASQIKDIVSVMFPMDYDKDVQFVKENEPGNFVYVMVYGKALASRNEKVLFKLFSGKLFGEPQAFDPIPLKSRSYHFHISHLLFFSGQNSRDVP